MFFNLWNLLQLSMCLVGLNINFSALEKVISIWTSSSWKTINLNSQFLLMRKDNWILIILRYSDLTCGHIGFVVVFIPSPVRPIKGVKASVCGQVIFMTRSKVPPQKISGYHYPTNNALQNCTLTCQSDAYDILGPSASQRAMWNWCGALLLPGLWLRNPKK